MAERVREIAAAEDRRPDDEPPAKLIPFSLGAYRVKLRMAGEEGGGECHGTREETLGIASRSPYARKEFRNKF